MERHKKILGALFIVFSILISAFYISGLYIVDMFIEIMEHDSEAIFVSYIIRLVVGIIVFTIAIPSVIVGIGLRAQKEWALILALIIGIVISPFFPLGSALGVYAIVVFLMNHSEKSRIQNSGNAGT